MVTSIAKPNKVLKFLAEQSKKNRVNFFIIGDISSPNDFYIDGCNFYSLERQKKTQLEFAKICPEKHYARKNIGYLIAIKKGAELIIDTDDDNIPKSMFWLDRNRYKTCRIVSKKGWINIYRYFSNRNIWPRGLPLNHINSPVRPYDDLHEKKIDLPIQQGLTDEDPDVDAIYRLVNQSPIIFENNNRNIALAKGVWCPFNSQNTTWWKDAFPLLYLPYYCSFRMTDIWRSFVAQRIAWENNWHVLFHSPTVKQERNEHNLMKDFIDEIPGYLNNEKICNELNDLDLTPGVDFLKDNLLKCYKKLIELGVIIEKELILINAWINDLTSIDLN